MNINYNISHELLQHEALRDLSNKPLIVTWLVWSQMLHMCWHVKDKPHTFRQGDFCKDLKLSQSTCASALKYLIDKDLIKCIKPYSKIGNQPGMYVLTQASIRIAQNLYQKRSKPVSPRDRVNNPKDYLKEDVTNIPSSLNEKKTTTPALSILSTSNENKNSWEK